MGLCLLIDRVAARLWRPSQWLVQNLVFMETTLSLHFRSSTSSYINQRLMLPDADRCITALSVSTLSSVASSMRLVSLRT